MADYEHSSNFHKITSKIEETNNLKDLQTLKKKLGELEQDDEVRELIAKCDERVEEIKDYIKEDKYQKAVSVFNVEGDNLDAQISSFQEIKGYKESIKYITALETEKEYRFLLNSFNSEKFNWKILSGRFKALGEYKKAQEYATECEKKEGEKRREKELLEQKKKEAECEEKYQRAQHTMDESNPESASVLFKELGDYKDSKQKAEECDKQVTERNNIRKEKEEKKKRKTILIILALILVGLATFMVISLVTWKSDESAHWHSVLGSQSSYSEHNWKFIKEVAPSCENEGMLEYECDTCGKIRQEVIRPLGHSIDTGIVTKEPTCTEEGWISDFCTTCGVELWTESIPAKGHTSDSGKVTKEPTCTEKGVKTYTCTACGAILKTEFIDMKPHSFIDAIRVQPQCETRGLADSKCSVCGFTTTRTLDATGHDWESVSKKNPSCTEEGSESFECKICSKTKVEVIPASGHKWVLTKTVNPTCVSDGHLEYRCSVCSIMKTEKPDATGHNYLDGFCLSCGFDRNQYHVGDIGPAGGYIFYDCDADNSSGNKDGLKSSACGWRFLEAAPSDLNDGKTFVWGDNRTYGTKTGLGSGKTNTSIIVSQASNSRVPNAATVCNDFSYLGFDDWFLPSKDELVQMYENLHKSGLGGFAVSDGYYYYYEYWSSSEGDYYGIDAWIQYFYDGSQYGSGRGENARVRPVRAF